MILIGYLFTEMFFSGLKRPTKSVSTTEVVKPLMIDSLRLRGILSLFPTILSFHDIISSTIRSAKFNFLEKDNQFV